jgi:hypothetical protein
MTRMRWHARTLGVCAVGVALCGPFESAGAQSVYGKAGFLGAGVGYAHGLSESWTVRADVTTIGTYHRDGSTNDFDYTGKLRSNQAGAYADWFPFDNGFRLTAGLHLRDTRIDADGHPTSSGTVTVGDTRVSFGPGDDARARVKLPSVAPYIGIGWGHNVLQRKAGWGFIADVGVAFGKPRVSFDVSDSLRTKLNLATGGNAQREIDKQRDEFKDDFDKLKVFPQLYVGAAYYF